MKKVILEFVFFVFGLFSKATKNFDLEPYRKFSVLVVPAAVLVQRLAECGA